MKTFHLEIAAPDGKRFSGEAEQLSVRSIAGEVAILAGHALRKSGRRPHTY